MYGAKTKINASLGMGGSKGKAGIQISTDVSLKRGIQLVAF